MARLAVSTGLALWGVAAQAALKPGDLAPDFTLPAAVGGKDFTFALADAQKKGPVVVYFYPKSFTRGCTLEAHEFADHAADFEAAGASIIGVSSDTIETQRDFSTKECRDKFPVAADARLSAITAYDAKREQPSASGETLANRVSYVVAGGKIVFALTSLNPIEHVQSTLAFVRKWRDEHQH
ncbi:MAG TPA: peroxiredoxin [Methylocystis sp.]|nr:peroxiredoxin [Methylocystis sp.]